MSAIEEQMQLDLRLKNEFFLVDAINIMLKRHALLRVQKVETWLDTGTIEATLQTNRYLLERSPASTYRRPGVEIKPPVFIHETADIQDSTIGPYASIGPNCRISGSRVEDSILEAGCDITDVTLKDCMVGRQARVQGTSGTVMMTLNIGDDSSVMAG